MLVTRVGLTNLSVSSPRKSAGGYSALPARRRREAESGPERRNMTGSVRLSDIEFLFIGSGGGWQQEESQEAIARVSEMGMA